VSQCATQIGSRALSLAVAKEDVPRRARFAEMPPRQAHARGLLSTAVSGNDLLKMPGMTMPGMPAARGDVIEVPTDLLERLLETDAAHSATVDVVSVNLEGVLDAVQPHRAAKFMHTELPKRFAMGLNRIETLPGWRQIPELEQMHDLMQSWFNRMRLVRRGRDVGLKDFTACTKMIWHEGRNAVQLVTAGMHRLRHTRGLHYTDEKVDRWLDDFLTLRISTTMLMDQYIAITRSEECGKGAPTGIVKKDCDPTQVCESAAKAAQRLCKMHTGKQPSYHVETYVAGKQGPQMDPQQMTYIPGYLRYIMLEILKNSFAATVQNAVDEQDLQKRVVHVLVSMDDEHCVVRVSDRAGGIAHRDLPHIWSYLYGATARADEERCPKATGLSGYGIGLPLGRLHARYLGGDLRLESFPGFGTDVYLHLPTISTEQREDLR